VRAGPSTDSLIRHSRIDFTDRHSQRYGEDAVTRGDDTDPIETPPADPAPSGGTGSDKPDADKPGADGPDADGLGDTVVAITADDIEPGHRRRLLGNLVRQARRSGIGQFFRPKAALRWMTDTVGDIAPYIQVRDLDTLRRHHDGLEGDHLAERLIRNAALATAGVGATGGGIAAVEWVATPTLLSAPVLLAAETVAVVAIELKLVGELHEVYRQPIAGTAAQRAGTMVQAWSSQRGVNPLVPGVGVGAVLGTAARKELRETLLRRFGRNLTTLGPLLTGAAVASYLNRRATKALGERLSEDLRRTRPLLGAVVERRALPES
jgi:hypothetical protein